MDCEENIYTPKSSPFSKRSSPYSKSESPFTAAARPYSGKRDVYSCYQLNLLLAENGTKLLTESGLTIAL